MAFLSEAGIEVILLAQLQMLDYSDVLLLTKLISGEIRVRDAERAMEAVL